jgi:putative hemolysin
VARPLDALATLSRPAVAVLGVSTNLVVRLLGGRPQAATEEISPEELRDLVTGNPELDEGQRDIISGALELQDRMLRHVLVPRGAVLSVPSDATVAQARHALAEAGHSRAPVTRGHHLDQVLGVVHWRSLVDGDDEPVVDRIQPPLMLPDTVRVLAALHRFREERQQLAIVIDEHGSVDGIVTLEDLLEEIVGEIWDETDTAVADALRASDGSLVLPGTYPVHDLPDVGVDLDLPASTDFTTVAGLVLKLLGRVPEAPGDVVEASGWQLEVLEVAHHAVTRVAVRPAQLDAGSPAREG